MISVIIPTLDEALGKQVGQVALLSAGLPAHLIVSHDPKRTGFTKTVNRGIKRAPAKDDICLLNDDIKWFSYGWLATLRRALYQNKKFGMTAPTGGSNTQPMATATMGDFGLQEVKHIPYWCVLIKRACLDDVGLLDEAFIHYASDNWHNDVARRKGWKLIWVKDVYLEHVRHGSGRQSAWKRHDQAVYRRRKAQGRL